MEENLTQKIEAKISPTFSRHRKSKPKFPQTFSRHRKLKRTPFDSSSQAASIVAVFQLNPADDHCLVCHGESCIASSAVEMEVVVEIEMQLNKKDVEEVNRRTGGNAGADKHTNIATALLGEIKERSLDSYAKMESEMMIRGGIDKNELLSMLRGKGDKMEKLRFAIMHLISTESLYPSEVEMVEVAPRESEVDTSVFQYVKKIKSLNIADCTCYSLYEVCICKT